MDLYYTGPAQHIILAGWYLDDPGHGLSDLSELWNIRVNVLRAVSQGIGRGIPGTRPLGL